MIHIIRGGGGGGGGGLNSFLASGDFSFANSLDSDQDLYRMLDKQTFFNRCPMVIWCTRGQDYITIPPQG